MTVNCWHTSMVNSRQNDGRKFGNRSRAIGGCASGWPNWNAILRRMSTPYIRSSRPRRRLLRKSGGSLPAGWPNRWKPLPVETELRLLKRSEHSLSASYHNWRSWVAALSQQPVLLRWTVTALHGLGRVSQVREIAVRWPSGASQTLNQVAADQRMPIEDP